MTKYKAIQTSPRGIENMIKGWYHGHKPEKGAYYCKTRPGLYTALDNRTGDMWTESFQTKRECLKWLKEDVEYLDESDDVNTSAHT